MRLPRDTGNSTFHRASIRALRHIVVALALAVTLLPTGCVRRRLAVRSNPPGALVFVDNQQIGTTPCSVDFTYYGTREIRLVKPGFETLTVNQPIPMPWYQIPPIDFVSENVMPNKIEDHRTVAFDLQPQLIVPTEQLLDRANQLRQETLSGTAAPPPVLTPTPLPPTTPPPVSQTTPPSNISPPPTFGPSTVGPTFAPTPAPYSTPSPAPFSPPTLPAGPPPGSPQQGPPLVSPPLR
ncbi:MAG: PEGA domain-containing protein [Pirellulales bacterium]